MFLGLRHRQLKADSLNCAVQFLDRELALILRLKTSDPLEVESLAHRSEQQISRPYPGQVSWTASVYILKHPALGSIHREAMQSRIDRVYALVCCASRVPESGVARLEFCHQAD